MNKNAARKYCSRLICEDRAINFEIQANYNIQNWQRRFNGKNDASLTCCHYQFFRKGIVVKMDLPREHYHSMIYYDFKIDLSEQ